MAATLDERAKKFLEGWTSHKSESSKGWKKCWTVLRGNSIFLFSSEKSTKENMICSLSLGHGTSVCDIKSKKEFKFELATMSQKGQFKKDIFKFNKENDCHLWKAYILAIATGSIPTDLRLLPGQQSDVYEAMVEVRKQNGTVSSLKGQTEAPNPRNGRSHNLPEHCLETEEYNIEIDDPAIRQLNKRLEELAEREINDPELTPSVSSWPINEIMDTIRPNGSSLSSFRSVASQDATVAFASSHASPTDSVNQKSTHLSKRSSFLFSNHAFYSNGTRSNGEPPSWFVNCSRDQTEEILTNASRFGTVLMRASSAFPMNGNYVISFRREHHSKVVVSHYNIIRAEDGFRIDVENKHPPMQSLSDVMEFFLTVAGKTAKPLTSNDLMELIGKYQAVAFPPVVEEDEVQLRSVGSSVHSLGLPSSNSQRNLPESNRSSSIGSQSSRNSRGSLDFANNRISDPHSDQVDSYAGDRRSSAASSVFYQGHELAKAGSEVDGSPPSYRGLSAGSTSVDGAPGAQTEDLYSGSGSLKLNEDARSSQNDAQVYSNQSETISPEKGNGNSIEEQRFSGESRSYGSRGSVSHYGSDAYDVSRSGSKSTPGSSVVPGDSGSDSYSQYAFDTQSSRFSGAQHQGPLPTASTNPGGRLHPHGTVTSDTYTTKQNSSKHLCPPLPPPKPGPQEIYMLMKPLPSSTDGDYSTTSEISRTSNEDTANPNPATSVRDLARMLQCSLEK